MSQDCEKVYKDLRLTRDGSRPNRALTDDDLVQWTANANSKSYVIKFINEYFSSICTNKPYDEIMQCKLSIQRVGFFAKISRQMCYVLNQYRGTHFFPFQLTPQYEKGSIVLHVKDRKVLSFELPQIETTFPTNVPSIFFILTHMYSKEAPSRMQSFIQNSVAKFAGGHTLITIVNTIGFTVLVHDPLNFGVQDYPEQFKEELFALLSSIVPSSKGKWRLFVNNLWLQYHMEVLGRHVPPSCFPKSDTDMGLQPDDKREFLKMVHPQGTFLGHCGVLAMMVADVISGMYADMEKNGGLFAKERLAEWYIILAMYNKLSIPFLLERVKCFVTYLRKLRSQYLKEVPIPLNTEIKPTPANDMSEGEQVNCTSCAMLEGGNVAPTYKTYNGRRYKIRFGNKGGTFILVDKKRKYIKA